MSRNEPCLSPEKSRSEERPLRIVYHPHARRRMEERGVTEDDVREAVEKGIGVPARQDRRKYQAVFPFERFRLSKYYRSKLVDVHCVEEADVIIVLTVVAEYF